MKKNNKLKLTIFTIILIITLAVTALGINAFAESGTTKTVVADGIKYVLEDTNTGIKRAYVLSYAETDEEKAALTEINILSVIDGYTVTSIRAVSNKGEYPNVTKVTIPDTVTSIDTASFSGMEKLQKVELGNSVKYIGSEAFEDCTELKYIDLSEIVSIEYAAFKNCKNLKKVNLSDNLEEIGCLAFSNTGLTSITIPEKAKLVCNCDWDDYYLSGHFEGCKNLKTVIFEYSGTDSFNIPKYAFQNCTALKKVYLPENAKVTIGPRAFKNCTSLAKIYDSENIVAIDDAAFSYCKSLKEITFGKNLKTVGEKAFLGCEKLQRVNFKSTKTVPTFKRKAFSSTADGIKFVADKAIAKNIKTNLKNTGTKNAKVYSVSYQSIK